MSVLTRGRDVNPRSATPNMPRRKGKKILLRSNAGEAFLQFPDLTRQARAREGLSGAWLEARALDAWPNTSGVVTAIKEQWPAAKTVWSKRPDVRTATVAFSSGAVGAGEWFRVDVLDLVRPIANGAKDYGFRVQVGVNADRFVHSFDTDLAGGGWRMVLEFNEPDDPPDVLPAGGVVSASKWTVELTDLPGRGRDNDDTLGVTAMQVQIDPAANSTAPAFDSGQRPVDVPELRLADLTAPAYPGLAEAAVTRQRSRAQVSGRWTKWSDWSDDIAYYQLVNGVFTSPAAGQDGVGYITDSTPVIELQADRPLKRYRLRLTAFADRSKVLYDSEETKVDGGPTFISTRIPEKWKNKRVLTSEREFYWLHARLWDRTDRVTSGGAKAHRDVWLKVALKAGQNPAPGGVSVAQVGLSPAVRVRWSRSVAADAWVIVRNGVRVARVQHSAVRRSADGSGWSWVDKSAPSYTPLEYQVRAVEESGNTSEQSPPSPVTKSSTIQTAAEGTWLIRRTGETVVFHADDPLGQLQPTQRRTMFQPPGQSHDTGIVTAPSSQQGPVELFINPHDDTGQTLDDALAVCQAIADSNGRETVQFASGTFSRPVRVWDLDPLPVGDMLPDDAWHRAVPTIQEVTGDLGDDDD